MKEPILDYFYGSEAEQFSFYRIPKVLFTDERFRHISTEAKVLYGLLLDRMSLSVKNRWLDSEGRVYIIFTIEDVMTSLGCADQKACKLMYELESKAHLIERKRQGLGKPNLIYVKNFITASESQFKNCENHDSGILKITNQESLKSRSNYTDKNNTDISNTESYHFTSFSDRENHETMRNEVDKRQEFREQIKRNIAFDALIYDYPSDGEEINEILELLVDTVCSNKPSTRISGDEKPTEVVRDVFMQLNSEHIRFVIDSMKKTSSLIMNMRQYLLAALYNAPMTISNTYRSQVRHNFG